MKPSIIPIPQKTTYTGGCSAANGITAANEEYDSSIAAEGYRLIIKDNLAGISFSDDAGRFYAYQTLKQIKASCVKECDNLIIEDKPRFSHRGFSIDCARHIFSIEDLKKVIDTAAYFKMNVFHWHLTDDQGWRLPVKKYPELISTGSIRKNSLFGKVDEGGPYGGSFTESEIKEIVEYCSERFIEVIPEIDMPGHTTSVLAAYPRLGCTGEKIEVGMKEGIYDTVLCLGNPDSVTFMKDVLDTVCDLFPGRYVHIGGDETPRKKWSECPKCREKLKALGSDDFNRLQGYFIKEISDYLRQNGKTAITWNESLKGDVLGADDVVVQRWMDSKGLSKTFADKGGKVIETDFYHCYCDYPYGMTPVKKAYNFSLTSNINDESKVLGTEAEMWTEYIRSFDDLTRMLYPRISAIAENAWSAEKNKNYSGFVRRHEALRPSIEEMGVKVIPVKEWGYPPLKRLASVFSFFKGSFSVEAIRNSLKNNK